MNSATGAGTAKDSFDDRIHARIVEKLRDWVAIVPNPNLPLVGIAGADDDDDVLSPKKILENVEQRNPKGEEFIARWVDLVVDHIAKSQLR